MLFKKTVRKTTKVLKGISRLNNIVYIAMCPLVMYSNNFKIVTTVTVLADSRTGLISGIFLFKTVILYHIHYNTRYKVQYTTPFYEFGQVL